MKELNLKTVLDNIISLLNEAYEREYDRCNYKPSDFGIAIQCAIKDIEFLKEASDKEFTQRDIELAYIFGLMGKMGGFDEFHKDIQQARGKLDVILADLRQGRFNPITQEDCA